MLEVESGVVQFCLKNQCSANVGSLFFTSSPLDAAVGHKHVMYSCHLSQTHDKNLGLVSQQDVPDDCARHERKGSRKAATTSWEP